MAGVDTLLMGRGTFEKVCSYDIVWPYEKPVYVLSKKLMGIPEEYQGKAELVNETLSDVLAQTHQKGHGRLYLDGGNDIQSFLEEDLINEMVITVIPVLLGGGIPLFWPLPKPVIFECKKSRLFFEKVVQNHYIRSKDL